MEKQQNNDPEQMNQCSPVADHSLREALSCHVSIETHTWKSTKIHYGQQIGREKGGREKCVPGDLLRHCAKYRRLKRKGKNVHRATYCAIARSTDASNGRERMCTGRPTAPLREVPTPQTEGKNVHRATYCARNYPLPLLPSGPGGVGGITSRRTRHRNHFITKNRTLTRGP
jgi:hypothetical protein